MFTRPDLPQDPIRDPYLHQIHLNCIEDSAVREFVPAYWRYQFARTVSVPAGAKRERAIGEEVAAKEEAIMDFLLFQSTSLV